MPEVRNAKSRAKRYCDGAAEDRGWYSNTIRSRFVRAIVGAAIFVTVAVTVRFDLTTVICQEPSVSRECGTPAKLQHPADGSCTICLACTRFRRHRVRCFNGTGGASWSGGSSRGSSSLRRYG